MIGFRPSLLSAVALVLTLAATAHGQSNTPRIGYAFPAGARQGASLVVIFGGRYLDGSTRALVSGSGVQAKVLECLKPRRPEQISQLVTKVNQLEQKKSKRASSDEMLLLALKRKLAGFVGGPPAPAIAENAMVLVTIDPDAEPGPREIRLETPKGLTNPQVFHVGQLPEFFKQPQISPDVLTGKNLYKYREEPRSVASVPPTSITLPAVLNGQIMPGAVDRYAFPARKGQRLVIAAGVRELIPYISDAVPGWFQAALTLLDEQGHELAYADHFRFDPDPVLFVEAPRDGQYVLEIRDSIYRGREDFVYRVTVGELPYLTGIFPLGGPAGEETSVQLSGWNLPAKLLKHDAKDQPPGIYPLGVRAGEIFSNALPFAVDTLPECREQEPRDAAAKAQELRLPMIVNGRIDRPDEVDVFSFAGRAGTTIVAEVTARRLKSPLDSWLRLTDASGKELAYNDDYEDPAAGLTTQHADSYLRATLPADGTYYVHLGDTQHQGGAEFAYRLRIGPAQPDFALRVVPSSFTAKGNSTVPLVVRAVRRDGFSGPIALELKDVPEGFLLVGDGVPPDHDQAQLTLKIVAAEAQPVNLSLEGRATIDGREVLRVAVPAEDMTQAFEYHHLVPSQELKLAVTGRFVGKPAVMLLSQTPLKIPRGGTARVRFYVPSKLLPDNAKFALRGPPDGLNMQSAALVRERLEVVFANMAEKVQPGQKGTLSVVALSAQPPMPPSKGRAKRNQSLATLPGIPFEIE